MTRRTFATLPLAAASAQSGSRQWTIFIVQHSHIDVGYTEKQEIIAEYHRQFIRQAVRLALSPAQRDRDPNCRFKFTCEGFWQVEQFLNGATTTERRDLVRALHEGLMELTSSYFHFTELPDQDLLRRSVSYAAAFARREEVPLVAAMESDINGLSWGMADAQCTVGVRYLSMNVNPSHGGFPFGRPLVPFYWRSPLGRRLLTWNGLTYETANLFGLMGGLTPDSDPGVPGLDLPGTDQWIDIRDISVAERKVFPFLEWLEKSGYPHDFLPLMGSGLFTDNSPPGDQYCRILQQWNSRHGSRVVMRTATLAEFFRHLETHAKDIPVHRGEWTDWWSDGAASAPLDTMVFRNAQRTRRLVDLLDPRHALVPSDRLTAIDKKLMLYAEHTFGPANTSSPQLLTHQVFLRKTQHAVEADQLSSAALYEILRHHGEGEFADRRPLDYTVINPLDVPLQSAARLPLRSWDAPAVKAGCCVIDAAGKHCESQMGPGWVYVPLELAPREERRLHLEPQTRAVTPEPLSVDSFANPFYRISWRKEQGITDLVDLASGLNVLDAERGGLASPVYQIFPGASHSKAGHDYPPSEVSSGRCTAIRRSVYGPLLEQWEFEYQVPGATRYSLLATFHRRLPQIELAVRVDKTYVRDPEGMYVLFPLVAEDGVWYLDKPGAPIRPGLDQLPGTCCDYYCIQHGGALVGRSAGAVFTALDAPLVHIGGLNLWKYSTTRVPSGPLYSWLTNNEWDTNFRVTCGGSYEFRYFLQVGRKFADSREALAQCRALSYPPLVTRL
jgi:hypothetical protein